MYGIIFLVISILAFGGLYMYIKKSDSGSSDNSNNRKELMNELYNKQPKNKKQENKKTSETQVEVEENNNDENTDDENKEEEYEEYTYDSYKSDEEYLRIARLMKNIYFTIVAVVLMVLGILYIMLFKLS